MILSNFRPMLSNVASSAEYATVTCAEKVGPFWNKESVVTDRIVKNRDNNWYFVDNGIWCPEGQVEALSRAHNSNKELDNATNKIN